MADKLRLHGVRYQLLPGARPGFAVEAWRIFDTYPARPESLAVALANAAYWQGYRDEAEEVEAR